MGILNSTQGLDGSVFSNQRHFACNAQLFTCKLETPIPPPKLSGLVTISQRTIQLPPFTSPFTSFHPFHKKTLRILSIDLITYLGIFIAIRRYIGIADSINRINDTVRSRSNEPRDLLARLYLIAACIVVVTVESRLEGGE
jgi:hypothetical protein